MSGPGDMLPLELGGGPSPVDLVHNAIRSARGVRGSGPVGGLEDGYLRAESEAIEAGNAAVERAALQAFGFTATDHLPVLEELYALPPEGTEQDRRDRVAAFEREPARADIPAIVDALALISPFWSVITPTRDESTITLSGKVLAPRDGSIPYGGWASQNHANYADESILHVAWDLVAAGQMPSTVIIADTARMLRRRLPAWMDFSLHQLDDGFYADGGPDDFSFADWTAFDDAP